MLTPWTRWGGLVGLCLTAVAQPVMAQEPADLWAFEATIGGYGDVKDGYNARLEQFGYGETAFQVTGLTHAGLAASWRAHRNVELVMDFCGLGEGSYLREDTVDTWFSWDSYGTTAFVRALAAPQNDRAAIFVEAGAGLAWARTDYSKGPQAHAYETQTGGTFAVGAGLRAMASRHVGFVLKARHTWAPVLANLSGEVHDVGGTAIDVGLRVTF